MAGGRSHSLQFKDGEVMSYSQSTPAFRLRNADTGSALGVRLYAGLGLLALGTALFALGIFHGFENGSCSTTGYSEHYGPVQRCAQGVGWWMLLLMVGLGLAGAGAVLSKIAGRVGIPALFIAIGAPFLALALGGGNIQLLQNATSSTGKIYAGIFGACFVIAGAAWGVIAGLKAFSRLSGGPRLGGLFASALGVALAFAIAAGTSSAIGTSQPPATRTVIRGVTHTNPAITRVQRQAARARKLAACIAAAGTDTAKIQVCEADYMG
jgi:hypothetical protein